jgi:hypothetical protein
VLQPIEHCTNGNNAGGVHHGMGHTGANMYKTSRGCFWRLQADVLQSPVHDFVTQELASTTR